MTNPNRSLQVGSNAPWPKGKPRHDLDSEQLKEWRKLRRRIERVTRQPRGYSADGVRPSRRSLAEYCGVGSKSVTRWLRGDRTPSSDNLAYIIEWLSLIDPRSS